jgi:hypothetical protein
MTLEKRDWRELCEAASKEQDPEKLRNIISELIKVLDERKLPQRATEATRSAADPKATSN